MPMKSLARKFLSSEFGVRLLMALVWAIAVTHPPLVRAAAATVSYYALPDPGLTGLGFLADGKSLYVGGCSVFDLAARRQLTGCRYPLRVRWGTVSPDGTLLLATSFDGDGSRAKSFQLNAQTGAILSTRPGIHFAPPIAVHSSNTYWAASKGSKSSSAAETVSIIDKNWKVVKSGIYANTQRIFTLEFSGNEKLLINGGGPVDGATLETFTWSIGKSDHSADASSAIRQRSNDGRFGFRLTQRAVEVVSLPELALLAQIDFDPNLEEPQVAFSPDGQWFAAKGYRTTNANRQYEFALLRLVSPK
jgi:hypothetical protein